MLWFNPGGPIAIGDFQREYFLQMIGSCCSGSVADFTREFIH